MINNLTLVGRLTKDPDLKYTSGGTAVVTFTLAVNRNFTSADGTREADFINCVIWRKPAETLANYARKGTLLGVTGRIQTRSYDNQQGQRVYVTEVLAKIRKAVAFQIVKRIITLAINKTATAHRQTHLATRRLISATTIYRFEG